MRVAKVIAAAVLASIVGLAGCASGGHHGAGKMPTEPGQGAFGALAEIVQILERNPDTDWSQVDVDGLRRHLVDMNALTLEASVKTIANEDSVVYQVSGEGKTLRAIQAMVPAHAAELKRSYQWDSATEKTATGVNLTLTSKDAQQLQRFKALGFFGIMATGSHHQMHHLRMATGQGHAH